MICLINGVHKPLDSGSVSDINYNNQLSLALQAGALADKRTIFIPVGVSAAESSTTLLWCISQIWDRSQILYVKDKE